MSINFRKSLFIIILLLFKQTLVAQVNMPSIDVQSMMKYGSNDVSHYSGGVDISVPIYTIKSFVDIPIALKYNGGQGIRVREHASRVGLGWSLQAQTTVSRIIRNNPDEGGGSNSGDDGFQTVTRTGDGYIDGYIDWSSTLLEANDLHKQDQEPDQYYYSTLKRSGSFYIDKNKNIVHSELNKLDIQGEFSFHNGNFVITETDGSKYYYSAVEETQDLMYYPQAGTGEHSAMSSMLTKIVAANKRDSVVFNYSPGSETYYSYDNVGEPIATSDNVTLDYAKTKTNVKIMVLESIIWNQGRLEFKYDENRKDLNGGLALKSIVLKELSGDPLKKIQLGYSYFGTDQFLAYDVINYHQEDEDKGANLRLKLDYIQFNDSNDDKKNEYRFEYNDESFLPERSSKSIDHWGYYNGASNQTLCPEVALSPNGQPLAIAPADRKVNSTKAQAGVLKRIIYPTGGYTDFVFESNTMVKRSNNLYLNGLSQNDEFATTARKIEPGEEGTQAYLNKHRTTTLDCSTIKTVGDDGYIEVIATGYSDPDNAIIFTCKNRSTNETETFGIFSIDQRIKLAPGVYDVVASSNAIGLTRRWDLIFMWTSLTEDDPNNPNTPVGGLRIARIDDYDGEGKSTSRSFSYQINNNSTGKLIQEPKYIYLKTFTHLGAVSYPDLFYANNPIYPLRLTQNSCVGYSNVEEITMGNGKTEYRFSTSKDFTNFERKTNPFLRTVDVPGYGNLDIFPLPEKVSCDLVRGKLIEKKQYKTSQDDGYELQKTIKNYYAYYDGSETPKLSEYFSHFDVDTMFTGLEKTIKVQKVAYRGGINGIEYHLPSKLVLLDKTIVDTYTANGIIQESKSYTYNNIAQLIKESSLLNGKSNEIKYYYPSSDNLSELFDLNRIETAYKMEKRFNGQLAHAWKIEYTDFDGLILPSERFVATTNAGGDVNYILDAKFESYNEVGNLTEMTNKYGIRTSYLWSYGHDLPVVFAENASLTQLKNGLGSNVVDAIGASYNSDFIKQSLTPLKTLLPNAQIKSAIYKLLRGVSELIDPNGISTYYEYDSFGRLKHVKDTDGHILKAHEYHYKSN